MTWMGTLFRSIKDKNELLSIAMEQTLIGIENNPV